MWDHAKRQRKLFKRQWSVAVANTSITLITLTSIYNDANVGIDIGVNVGNDEEKRKALSSLTEVLHPRGEDVAVQESSSSQSFSLKQIHWHLKCNYNWVANSAKEYDIIFNAMFLSIHSTNSSNKEQNQIEIHA